MKFFFRTVVEFVKEAKNRCFELSTIIDTWIDYWIILDTHCCFFFVQGMCVQYKLYCIDLFVSWYTFS